MIQVLFWIFIFIILYGYFGYPFMLVIISKMFGKPVKKRNITPSISMIIAACDEEGSIRQKLLNSWSLDYPKDKLKIIVASNGSTDKTDSIVKEYLHNGVRLESYKKSGKTYAQNMTVPKAKGEIIIFSDANAIYRKDALKKLIRNFADESVGVVCGYSIMKSDENSSEKIKESLYLKYEYWIRKTQTIAGTCTTGAGEMFAIRKKLYQKINENHMEDFMLPLLVSQKGYRAVFEFQAISEEYIKDTNINIFNTKSRIITQDIKAFMHIIWSLLLNNPWVGFNLISHKLIRWLVPYFLVVIFLCNILLLGDFIYDTIFILQIMFYALAIGAYIVEKCGGKAGLFNIVYYFCLVNIASAWGVLRGVVGIKLPSWEKQR